VSESGPPASGSELPEAVVRDRGARKRRISPVWIIPIVAAVIGAGLAYRAYQERGIEVTITFQTAEGVTPGKTAVRLRDVEIGLVKDVRVGDDLSDVIVTAHLSRHARHHLGEDAQFWVVRPRVTGGGVTGLGTLLSGAYIALLPASAPGQPPHAFKGLEEPPLDPGGGGLDLVLRSDALHGLNEGSQIFFRDIAVGAVDRYELEKDGEGVRIHVTIEADYAHLVHENTRFWNVSGIDISASLSGGFELDMESVRSLLVGGITFDTPGKPGAVAKDGAEYELHRHHHASSKGAGIPRGPHFVLEAPRRGSIEVGDSVYYRDEEVGKVVSHGLHDDARSVGIVVAIASRYAPLVRTNTVFWNASGISADFGLSGLHIHSESLKTLMEGGVAFATPDKAGARAAAGSVFELASEEPKHWVKWDPQLPVGSRSGGAAKAEPKEKVHHKEDAKGDPKSHHWFHHLFHGDGGS
jgi:paraquat-inducible protein B